MTTISNGNLLFNEAREAVARLELRGGAPVLLAKLQDMLKLHSWHGGHQLKVQNLLNQAATL